MEEVYHLPGMNNPQGLLLLYTLLCFIKVLMLLHEGHNLSTLERWRLGPEWLLVGRSWPLATSGEWEAGGPDIGIWQASSSEFPIPHTWKPERWHSVAVLLGLVPATSSQQLLSANREGSVFQAFFTIVYAKRKHRKELLTVSC